MAELMVRMGELAASAGDDVLVTLGLGSCIGLALLDRPLGLAGLAHIMLPAGSGGGDPAKFADTGVPALLAEITRLGARKARLEAVLVGGAQMLGANSRLDVGARNDAATRELLRDAGIRVVASETGGRRGRTIRVHVAEGAVTVKAAGENLVALWPRMREVVAR